MALNVDARFLPFGERVAVGRQRTPRRLPSSLWNLRALSRSNSSAIASFRAARLKNVRLRRTARMGSGADSQGNWR